MASAQKNALQAWFEDWGDGNAKCMGVLLDGRAQPSGIRRPGTDATMLLVLNAHHDVVTFRLPEAPGGRDWTCLVDTNRPDLDEAARFPFGDEYTVTGRSLLMFILRPDDERSKNDAARSFRHVMAAFERAARDAVIVPG